LSSPKKLKMCSAKIEVNAKVKERLVENVDSNAVNMLKVVVRNAHHNPNSALPH
jgi:hypothetical protein